MITMLENNQLDYKRLGIVVLPAVTMNKKWGLYALHVRVSPARRECGNLTMIACDKRGFPINNVDFLVGWSDGMGYPIPDNAGCFHLRLDRTYDPLYQKGPYWAGFVQSDIAEEVHGFGIPFGSYFEIKIVFMKI